MTTRLILAIVSTLLEEAALVVIVLWGLPHVGIHLLGAGRTALLVALMVAWGAYSIITYRIGSRALRRKPVIDLSPMVGSRGKVVSPLAPEGLIKIKGELWIAKSASERIDTGEGVIVVGQEGLKLIVHRSNISEETE